MQVIDHYLIYGVGFTIIGIIGGAYDLRTRRIPNWLTFPAMALGFLLHGLLDGMHGILSAAMGGAVVMAIMLLIVLMRGMGMGDLKLMLATGIFAGIERCLWVVFFTVMINGAIAVVLALRKKYLKRAAMNSLRILRHGVVRPLTPHPVFNLDNPEIYRFPFGVAVALGCVATLIRSGVIIR